MLSEYKMCLVKILYALYYWEVQHWSLNELRGQSPRAEKHVWKVYGKERAENNSQ